MRASFGLIRFPEESFGTAAMKGSPKRAETGLDKLFSIAIVVARHSGSQRKCSKRSGYHSKTLPGCQAVFKCLSLPNGLTFGKWGNGLAIEREHQSRPPFSIFLGLLARTISAHKAGALAYHYIFNAVLKCISWRLSLKSQRTFTSWVYCIAKVL